MLDLPRIVGPVWVSVRFSYVGLRERLKPQATVRRRFGYRRLFVLLWRDVETSSRQRMYRVYSDDGLRISQLQL